MKNVVLPSEIFPSSEEWLAIHLCWLEEFVHSQRQFDIQLLLYTVILEWYIKRWGILWKGNTLWFISIAELREKLYSIPAKSSIHSAVIICWICAPASKVGSTGFIWTFSLRAFSGDQDRTELKFYKIIKKTNIESIDLISMNIHTRNSLITYFENVRFSSIAKKHGQIEFMYILKVLALKTDLNWTVFK